MAQYGVDFTKNESLSPVISLKILYEHLPSTTGCENCSAHHGEDNKHWCCQEMSPSMYYVEFIYAWTQVSNSWKQSDRKKLILKAIRNYLTAGLSKGCIFYDKGCTIYNKRPLACRMYAITPSEVWDKRVLFLKEKLGDRINIKPQCSFVKSDPPVTIESEQNWFDHTTNCEKRFGVPDKEVSLHDLTGGSYRTFHDHLLVELFPIEFMEMLTKHRLTEPNKEQVDDIINQLSGVI